MEGMLRFSRRVFFVVLSVAVLLLAGCADSTPTGTFTADKVSGKTFAYSSAGSTGTLAFNADGTWSTTIGTSTFSGTWNITNGKLVCVTTAGGNHTITYTLLTTTSNSMNASFDEVNPADPNNPVAGTAAFTATFTTGQVSGKTFTYASTGARGTLAFNADGTWSTTIDTATFGGTWSIINGQLVCVTTSGGNHTLTYTALVSDDTTAIHTSVVEVNPADPANPTTYTATLALNQLLTSSRSSLEPIFFVHISDTHLDTKTATNTGLSTDGVDLTQSGKALMNALITEVVPVINPLAIVHTGDMTEKGYIEETWQTYSNLLKSSILTSYPNYVDIVGNHDVKVQNPLLDYEAGLQNFLLYSQAASRYGYTTLESSAGTVRLIRTNTAASTSANPQTRNMENIIGNFPASQQQALLNHPDRNQPVALNVVLGHSPVAESYIPYVPGTNIGQYMFQITDGNGRMKQLIDEFKAPIYLSGHVHAHGLEWLGNKSLVVRADTFGAHGKQATFYLVAYDFEAMSPAVKLVNIDATKPNTVEWPIVFITTPANSALGNTASYSGGNPNAQPFTTGQTIMLKTMVFSPETVTSVEYSIDDGLTSSPLAAVRNSYGRVWAAGVPLAGLSAGSHSVTVTATRSNGTTGKDSISIVIN